MKSLFKILAVGGLVFTMASCGTANDAYGNNYPNYPNNNGGVYRAPDGSVYRQGDVYRDRKGNVYQNGRVIRSGDIYGRPGLISKKGNNTVYRTSNARRLPPGQAKKIYGGSAKDYAPGQVKKRTYNNRTWKNHDYKGKKHNQKHPGKKGKKGAGKKR